MLFQFRAPGLNNRLTIYDETAGANAAGAISPGVGSASINIGVRIPAPTSLTAGETTLIVLMIGDSVIANPAPSAYSVVNSKVENFNPYDGLNYRYRDPVIGASNGVGSWGGRLGDKLINAGKFSRVIVMDPSVGGTTSGDQSKTGAFSQRYLASLWWARKYGWPISGSSGTWRFAVIYETGVNDGALSVSQGTFTTNAQSCFQQLRDYGCTADVFVAKHTLLTNAVNSAIQAAQAAVIDNPNGIYLGADRDSLTGITYNQADGTHPNDNGCDALAGLWSTIFQAHY